jgi:CMP-N-acetylneuraminic acid synthetase
MNRKNIVAIIPARGESKGILRKNIVNLGGFPLIAYSIVAVKLSKKIDRVIVSTDNKEIAQISLKYGAEVPFLRPKKYATDSSPDIEFVIHATKWLEKNEGFVPEYFVHMRPTTPLRRPQIIDDAIRLILKNDKATSLRSVHETRESPYKLFEMKNDYLVGIFPKDPRPEYYNLPRQLFPPVYQPNGYVDILKSKYILRYGNLHGNKILGFKTEDAGELDRKEDLERIEYLLMHKEYKVYKYLKKNYLK